MILTTLGMTCVRKSTCQAPRHHPIAVNLLFVIGNGASEPGDVDDGFLTWKMDFKGAVPREKMNVRVMILRVCSLSEQFINS